MPHASELESTANAASEPASGPKQATPGKTGSKSPRGRRKGPRPKHVPRRTCVACRESDDKRSLIRIVRTPEGTVEIDPTGKKNGRGAYLCDRPTCWTRAIETNVLSRALNVALSEDALQSLRDFAATLPDSPAGDVVGVPTKE
ncbi:MAG: YlxR family protein [Thermomicrobiales bacterium]